MPFGLLNSLATFQHFINEVIAGLMDMCIVVYLNDILIYSNSLEEHQQHVKEVLRRVRKFKLFAARADKCASHMTSVNYLGYILSPEGLRFANFYCQFIHNYLEIILLLTHLTCKGVP
ncbi:hypothetical protein BN946_scf184859.g5 [Trametes cinnabarina]|uniref:Reverse transcriptase domain-containing protein n=1 Tax=Pycnoporus cinnabarinus TaxID=5643 RepID=A0A060SQM8_PYCCI|nr:hypothetical protein BN946_scf184859.g5 [Trametes cinnabarina]